MTPKVNSVLVWVVPVVAMLGASTVVMNWRMSEKPPAASSGDESASIQAQLAAVATQPDASVDQLSELARRQRILAEAILALESRLDQALRSGMSVTSSQTHATPLTEADLELQDVEVQEQIRQDMLVLDNQFAAETTDLSWSVGAMGSIRGVVQQPEFAGSTITHLECRATMCRIQAEHESREALDTFAHGFSFALQWNATMAFQTVANADGTQSSTIVLSRDGHDLPY